MMQNARIHTTFLAGLALSASVDLSSSVAQATEPNGLSGQWRAAETETEAASRAAAIEKAARSFPVMARKTAKSRLAEQTKPTRRLEIQISGDQLVLTREARRIELKLGGAPVSVERDGKKTTVRAVLEGESLVVRTKGEAGSRTATYRLIDDGHLKLMIRMSGGRLKNPLQFEQTYARVDAPHADDE